MVSTATPKATPSSQKSAQKSKAAAATQATAQTATPTTTRPVASKPKASRAAAPVAAPTTVERRAKPAAAAGEKAPKVKRKLVRDSFTMPQADFDLIDVLKQRALNFRHSAKKGELLRAGLQVLAALPQAQLQAALDRITALKPGRPKKAG